MSEILRLEVHGRDTAFAKSEQNYHLTSTDAEAAAVRLLLLLHRKRHIPSYHLTSTDAEAAAVILLLLIHRKRHIPESYSIICIYVKWH